MKEEGEGGEGRRIGKVEREGGEAKDEKEGRKLGKREYGEMRE